MQDRPTEINGPLLKEEFNQLSLLVKTETEATFQEPMYGQCQFAFLYRDKYTVAEISGHECKFFVACNYSDPDNPPDAAATAQALVDAISDGSFEDSDLPYDENKPETWPVLKIPGDNVPRTFPYSAYVNSLMEAIAWCREREAQPVSEWPKQYLFPKPFVE